MSQRRKQIYNQSDSEQAKQVNEQIEESNGAPLSQSQGEDLLQNPQSDYRAIDELDRYENEGVDNEEIQFDPKARRAAQDELARRELSNMRIGDKDELQPYFDQAQDEAYRDRQRYMRIVEAQEQDFIEDEDRFNNPQDVKGKLSEWIKENSVIKYIQTKFSDFLLKWRPKRSNNDPEIDIVYRNRFHQMCTNNQQSLYVSYNHLKDALPSIAMWIGIQPSIILPQLHNCLYAMACKYYPVYKQMFNECYVRIDEVPIMDHIRELRYEHLGKLIKIKGVVTTRSEPFNQMRKAQYKCAKCGKIKGPYIIREGLKMQLGACPSCQSTGPFYLQSFRTLYENYQKLTVQESPSEVLPGRIPRSKEVLTYGDTIDKAKPGDQIEVVGVYTSKYDYFINIKHGFPLLTTLIEANNISVEGKEREGKFQAVDQKRFQDMSKQKNLAEKIYGSIAPSIYGHDFVKKSLTLAMFGGVQKPGVHRMRGDINVLLLGDPGIAKSQFLKSIQKVFPRCVYTTGKGATAVGLTASVKLDRITGEWKLEAGALVIADKGICLIDEFDKMSEQDRTSIHEAMEQQTISISKAGIVATLKARCSVIAAANPIKGHYDSALSFADNIELSDPILSRFDILNVIKDQVNYQIDSNLSTFVINSHIQNHPYMQLYDLPCEKLPEQVDTRPYIQLNVLKGYIQYARQKCRPSLTNRETDTIRQFYMKLREEAKTRGGIHIATRHLQAVIRMTEAHAKMHLRNQTIKEDAAVGIKTMLESFIQTQKFSIAKDIRRKFSIFLQ